MLTRRDMPIVNTIVVPKVVAQIGWIFWGVPKRNHDVGRARDLAGVTSKLSNDLIIGRLQYAFAIHVVVIADQFKVLIDRNDLPSNHRLVGTIGIDHLLIGVGSVGQNRHCLLYTSPSPRDLSTSRMPSSA